MSSPQHPASSHHSLAFRVMRLCRPSFQAEDSILRLDPFDLFVGEDLFDDLSVSPSLLDATAVVEKDIRDFSYRCRYQLQNPTDAMALPGLLMVPQSFGAIYLGETFSSYISVNNSSNFETRDVVIKAEIQTERQRLTLFTTKSPIESIRSGGRYDFIVEHDVKELGPHTLVCTALYNDGESERKYLPQFFKFVVANPLSVKTKVRCVKDKTYLEACIENHTKSNLFMDQVELEPAQNWSATVLSVDGLSPESKSLTRESFRPPVLIKANGGIQNYLYQLMQTSNDQENIKVEGNNILGKLQITWRTNLGEPGRLQTQHILGTPIAHKDVDFKVLELPPSITLEKPFLVRLSLRNHTDGRLGPFELRVSQDDATEEKAVMVIGLQELVLPQVEALSSTEFNLTLQRKNVAIVLIALSDTGVPLLIIDVMQNMIATRPGIQKISGIFVSDAREKKLYDTLAEVEECFLQYIPDEIGAFNRDPSKKGQTDVVEIHTFGTTL